ncbi:MAG: spore coat protein CotJB [Clostridia bacterium]|nr:spore coat protein CotJB [Clostridia bacterium]MBQ9778610.1 spore coat protein CotJB [Clostridia bacterium]MBR4032989.1 spore coat protein CotJB [Clostridia bacterium]
MMNMNCNGNSLLKRLQEVEFALYELTLYLDAYPESKDALMHYHSLLDARRALVAEYQAKHGPLTMYGNESTTSWDWASTPWPWEN